MLPEGQFNWVWVSGGLAVIGWLVGLAGLWLAAANRSRRVEATRQLEAARRAAESSNKRLFETLNAIPVALVEMDIEGKLTFANPAAHQLLGRRNAELIGLPFHSATWGITLPDGRSIPPDLLPGARALRGQTVRGFQHLMANPATRRAMLVSVTAMPIRDTSGRITGSAAAIVDIEGLTTPHPATPNPATADPDSGPGDDLTRRVFDAAASALVVVGADGQVRELNRTALLVLGRDGAEGDFADLFLDEDERAGGRQSLRAALAAPAGEAEPIVSRRGADEGIRWTLLPLPGVDGVVDALLLAGERADPTPAAVAPERSAQLASPPETAQAPDARRTESVGRGLVHDVNAVLAVMTDALDRILRHADDPSWVRRIGRAALAAGQKGELLTRRLTAFSQGDDEPTLRVLDVGVLLRGLEGRLRDLAGTGIEMTVESPSGAAPAGIDPVAFEGAVKALVRNAVEALNGHGAVTVRLERLAEGATRLSVRDNGPGMDRDLAARAAEPFFTTRDGAAGLGLSQAYVFARQAAGVLSIDSEPGQGVEVSITLPAATH